MAAQNARRIATLESERLNAAGPMLPVPAYGPYLAGARKCNKAHIEGADGIMRLDLWAMGGAAILGFHHPRVDAAVFSARTFKRYDPALELSERLKTLMPGMDQCVLHSSYDEGLAGALWAAKAVTGRDGVFFCDPDFARDDPTAGLSHVLDPHAAELAAVVVDPLGAPASFLHAVRMDCDRLGSVLIFDESRALFRCDMGGGQGWAGVVPDVTLIGEVLANGRPVGAVLGQRDVMRHLPEASQADAEAVAAGLTVLDVCAESRAPQRLRDSSLLLHRICDAAIQASGAASLVAIESEPGVAAFIPLSRPDVDAHLLMERLCALLFNARIVSYGALVPSLALERRDFSRVELIVSDVMTALSDAAERGLLAPGAGSGVSDLREGLA